MGEVIDGDFVITPSEEAKICLNCEKLKCNPNNCERFRGKLRELNKKENAVKIKEEFELPEIGIFSWNK